MKAVFVGIDRHQNPDVPELGGAKRDAKALWALFTDSIPGLSARLLLDDRATLDVPSPRLCRRSPRGEPGENRRRQ